LIVQHGFSFLIYLSGDGAGMPAPLGSRHYEGISTPARGAVPPAPPRTFSPQANGAVCALSGRPAAGVLMWCMDVGTGLNTSSVFHKKY
jgi:hypothetical protein